MTTAFDKLYVWMTLDGRRVIDLFHDEKEMELLQYNTLSALWEKHDPIKFGADPKTDEFFDELMHGDDGEGWIQHAKELGVIRKRTKEERIQQDRQLDEILT
jgi:hypothetical protein